LLSFASNAEYIDRGQAQACPSISPTKSALPVGDPGPRARLSISSTKSAISVGVRTPQTCPSISNTKSAICGGGALPPKCHFRGGPGPPFNTRFFWPTQVHTAHTVPRSVQPFCTARSRDHQTHRQTQTDRNDAVETKRLAAHRYQS